MTRCRFASRQELTLEQERLMLKIMPRMMAAVDRPGMESMAVQNRRRKPSKGSAG